MAVMRFTETTVIAYQSTRRYIPDDLYLHQRLCEDQWRTEEGGLGCSTPPPPKFRRFDKVEPDFKLSGKCLVFNTPRCSEKKAVKF
jgi:hypothetical protein